MTSVLTESLSIAIIIFFLSYGLTLYYLKIFKSKIFKDLSRMEKSLTFSIASILSLFYVIMNATFYIADFISYIPAVGAFSFASLGTAYFYVLNEKGALNSW